MDKEIKNITNPQTGADKMASKYTIHFTKQDAAEAYAEIERLGKELGKEFDWKKIKRASGDSIATILGILKRQVKEKNQPTNRSK